MDKFLDLVRRRVANVAIGASTARNMGSKGTIRRVRSFLAAGVLQDMATTPVDTFPCYLDEVTNKLSAEAGVEWGPARKFVNIFLRDALYNFYIRAAYKLEDFEAVLELPLDSYVACRLRGEDEGQALPRWKTVKGLRPDMGAQFQAVAAKVAQRRNTQKVHLDLVYWRGEDQPATPAGEELVE